MSIALINENLLYTFFVNHDRMEVIMDIQVCIGIELVTVELF